MRYLFLMLFGMSAAYASPYNSNVLIERGVDPQIINLAVTTFRQDVGYKMEVDYEKNISGEKSLQNFNVLYDPFASYGIDIRIQIPKKDMEKYDESDIKEELDEIMGLQSYLLSDKLYDEDSIKVDRTEGDLTVITFTFNEDAIPRELKYYNNLRGYIYVTNNVMDKIVLRNEDRFEHDGSEISKYEKTLYFTKVALNGGYLLRNTDVRMEAEHDDKPVEINVTGEVVKYWNAVKSDISWRSGAQKRTKKELDDEYHTIYVELDRTFPLLGQAARKQGYDLPKPFGVSFVTMLQQTTLHMTSFEVDGTPINPGLIGGDTSRYESQAMAGLVRADLWVLPFVNVGLILGGVTSSTDVTLDILSGFPPSLGLGGEVSLPPISTTSLLYGIGATVAGGAGNVFATIDMQYVTAFTEEADLELDMTIVTPIIGYNFKGVGVRALLGAQYQDLKEEIVARVDLNGDGTDNVIRVGLQSEKWAALVGVEKGFSRHWNGSLMYSQGEDRGSLNMMIGYRF